MDIRKVKKLIEMLEASNLEEIEIQEGEESVRLVKSAPQSQSTANQIISTNQAIPNPEVIVSEEVKEDKPDESQEGDVINSPMVGTFYCSASPGSKPFVSVGDYINEGDVVGIVEAMKMMNEIKSEFSGKLLAVEVENSQPVEFGQTLFLIGK